MRYRSRRSGTVSLCILLLLLIAPTSQAADCGDAVAACGCGDSVIADYTLTADLVCPASFTGNALTVGADDLTIDGQGLYKVEAPNATAVIQNRLHSGWRLQSVAIKGGLFGIQSDARPLPDGAMSGMPASNRSRSAAARARACGGAAAAPVTPSIRSRPVATPSVC